MFLRITIVGVLSLICYCTHSQVNLVPSDLPIPEEYANKKRTNVSIYELENQINFSENLESISIIQDSKSIHFDFVKEDIFTEDFKVLINDNLASIQDEFQLYSGRIRGHEHATAFLISRNDFFSLIYELNEKRYQIESLNNTTHDGKNKKYYIKHQLQKNSKFKKYSCGNNSIKNQESNPHSHIYKNAGACKELTLSFFTDLQFFNQYESIESAIGRIVSIVMESSIDFQNNFDQEIQLKINDIHLTSCEGCLEITDSNHFSNILTDFNNHSLSINSQSDINVFLSGRNFDGLTIGLANQNSICDENPNIILANILDFSWEQSFALTHEIGHILGNNHNDTAPNIMSSQLVNSSTWMNSSIEKINQVLASNSCMSECIESEPCDQIDNLQVDFLDAQSAYFSWDSQSVYEVTIIVQNLDSGEIIETKTTAENEYLTNALSACTNYKISIQTNCPSTTIQATNYIFSTDESESTFIERINVVNCIEGNLDLDITIVHHNYHLNSNLLLTINDNDFEIEMLDSIYTFELRDIVLNTRNDVLFTINQIASNTIHCTDTHIIDLPNSHCDLEIFEDFDTYKTPPFWTKHSSNTSYFQSPFQWKIGDNHRNLNNYGRGDNEVTYKTIDESPMVFIDDDLYSFSEYTGTVELYSAKYNLSDYTRSEFSIDYIFHNFLDKGANDSYFTIEIWNGTNWVTLINASNTVCPWSSIWNENCVNHSSIDITSFISNETQFRFIYSDGNNEKWTGMAAFDNFKLTASRAISGCKDLTALNYDENAEIHVAEICQYLCSSELIKKEIFTENNEIVKDANRIEANGKIVALSVSLQAQMSIELLPDFEITKGSNVELLIKNCKN